MSTRKGITGTVWLGVYTRRVYRKRIDVWTLARTLKAPHTVSR